jgi:transposase
MQRPALRPLSADECTELTQIYRTGDDRRLAQRVHAMLLRAEGHPIPEIARLLHVNSTTVCRWLDRLTDSGSAGLAISWGPVRLPHWNEAYEALLVETMRHDPRWYGLEQSLWTCPLLAGYLAKHTGITMSPERLGVLLRHRGLALKQPTPVVQSHAPQGDPKGSGRNRYGRPAMPAWWCWMLIRRNWRSVPPARGCGRPRVCPMNSKRQATTASRCSSAG